MVTSLYFVLFDDVSGLITRTPVEYAGIRVGSVEEINLDGSRARVRIRVNSNVRLYENSEVALTNRGDIKYE